MPVDDAFEGVNRVRAFERHPVDQKGGRTGKPEAPSLREVRRHQRPQGLGARVDRGTRKVCTNGAYGLLQVRFALRLEPRLIVEEFIVQLEGLGRILPRP